jgi:hypothetical protein
VENKGMEGRESARRESEGQRREEKEEEEEEEEEEGKERRRGVHLEGGEEKRRVGSRK